jgi:RES domain-containing protein
VAAHGSFDALDQEPYVLTCFEITHDASVRIVQPEDVPNPHWLTPIKTSPNQRKFADALLAEHPFILVPSVATRHSWNLLVSCDLAEGQFRMVSQERFGLDTRLLQEG